MTKVLTISVFYDIIMVKTEIESIVLVNNYG